MKRLLLPVAVLSAILLANVIARAQEIRQEPPGCLETKNDQNGPCAITSTLPNGDILSRPAALQRDWSDFAARFEHAFPVITTEDGWVVGFGCMADKSNTDAAAWALSANSGVFGAMIKRDGKFFIYGSAEDIPTPLTVWGVANGMTDSNMVRVVK